MAVVKCLLLPAQLGWVESGWVKEVWETKWVKGLGDQTQQDKQKELACIVRGKERGREEGTEERRTISKLTVKPW